jgi:hypothetical protein
MFGKKKPKRIVVKDYRGDSILGVLNPVRTVTAIGTLGVKGRLKSETQKMEKDAAEMAKLGYRIVASQQCGTPALGTGYQKVTYELVDPPK